MIGQTMRVTEGLDEGRLVLVNSVEYNIAYCESTDGDPFESGGNILTEFGFNIDKLQPADPNALYEGLHIVVLGKTESGKVNINKVAREGMTGVIIKLNDKRSQIKLDGEEEAIVLLGNNLMQRDENYVPPKPIDIKKNDIVVYTNDDQKKFIGKVSSKTSKNAKIRTVQNNGGINIFTIDRFQIIKVVSLKEIMSHTIVDNKKKEILEIENRIKTLKLVKADLFNKFDVDAAEELSYSLDEQIDSLNYEINSIKPEIKFKNSIIEIKDGDSYRTKFIDYLCERRKNSKGNPDGINYMGAMVHRDSQVFTKPNQIKLFKNIDKVDIVNQYKKPNTSDEYVGIEIECLMKPTRQELNALLIKNNLHFNCKLVSDGSIYTDDESGDRHPIEITFMAKRSKYKSTLKRLTDLLATCDVYINKTCGLHVHFDMRHRSPRVMYNKLANSQDILTKLVSDIRRDNQYCRKSHDTFEVQRSHNQKYSNINVATLDKHNTIEVRMHESTIDYNELTNWIDLLHNILDTKSYIPRHVTVRNLIKSLKLTKEMRNYVVNTIKAKA